MDDGAIGEPGSRGDSPESIDLISEFVFMHFFTDGSMCFFDDTNGVHLEIRSYRGEPVITYDIDPDTAKQNSSDLQYIWEMALDDYLVNETVIIELPGIDDIPDDVPTFHRAMLSRYLTMHGEYVRDLEWGLPPDEH